MHQRPQTKDCTWLLSQASPQTTKPSTVAPEDLTFPNSFLSAQTIDQVHQEKPNYPCLALYVRDWVSINVSKREVTSIFKKYFIYFFIRERKVERERERESKRA